MYTEDRSPGSPQTCIHHILGVNSVHPATLINICDSFNVPGNAQGHTFPVGQQDPGVPWVVQDTVQDWGRGWGALGLAII